MISRTLVLGCKGAMVVLALLFSIPLQANDGVIKHRIAVMKALGGHVGAIAAIVRGETATTADLLFHAQAVVKLSLISSELFPAGSAKGYEVVETLAKPSIWKKTARFDELLRGFQQQAWRFAAQVEGGALVSADDYLELGRTCKTCHDEFRYRN